MGPIKDDKNAVGPRRAWEPPAMTQLEIGAETKSAQQADENPSLHEPPAPTSPTTKLGFSFEMALPLSARSET
jgi:hypothetical protein